MFTYLSCLEDVNLRIVVAEVIAMFYELAREDDELSMHYMYVPLMSWNKWMDNISLLYAYMYLLLKV